MTHHLISFIGAGNYELAHYRFPDWSTADEARFFGAALVLYLQHQAAKSSSQHGVDRVVFIGTARSAFDALPEALGLRSPALAGLENSLRKAAREGDEQRLRPLLAELGEPLAEHVGLPCDLRVLPNADLPESQIAAVAVIVEGIAERDRVTLDVTHGLRHLPMLALTAALVLRHARKAEIAGIWYGALDLRRGREAAPAVDLAGLLEVANWISAFAIYEHSGDFGPFAARLAKAGMTNAASKLRAASFLERAARLESLPATIDTFTRAAPSPWPGMAGLFEAPLRVRLKGLAAADLYRRQRRVAIINIRAGDPLRATAYAYEALVTLVASSIGRNPRNQSCRKQTSDEMACDKKLAALARDLGKDGTWSMAVTRLRLLRNAVVHSDESKIQRWKTMRAALSSRKDFRHTMGEQIEILLPKK